MAKMIEVSKAEHEMLVAAYAQDGLEIARLEKELAAAKEDIRQLLIAGEPEAVCAFCKRDYALCENCKKEAEWRGLKEDK
jgi:hypothetical protein